MLFVAFPHSRVFGLRHERIALLPRHRCESAAFLPANLVEDDLGELAFGCPATCQRANSFRGPGCGFRSLDRLCLRHFLLDLHGSVPPWTGALPYGLVTDK